MKLHALVVSMSAAIYSAGSAYAATDNTPRPLDMTFDEIASFTKELRENQINTLTTQQGVNVHVNRQASQFKKEGLAGEHVYIVQLSAKPVALAARDSQSNVAQSLRSADTTRLFTKGRAATRQVEAYRQSLLQQQSVALNDIAAVAGVNTLRQQYTNSLNGFSIKMTEAQAAEVAKLPHVKTVTRSVNHKLLSDQGPLDIQADKLWSGEASPSSLAGQGEGQIVGVIDTGINSDHPSFADIGGDGYDHTNPWGAGNYVGDCVEEPDDIQCNDKLIGVRSYDMITDSYDEMIPGWPAIGEDYSGHGSHVASTAAGNVLYDVPYMVPGTGEDSDGLVLKEKLFPRISGVAPHANIISYQACYPDNDFGEVAGCPTEVLLSAIDDAISDGVDVINYSIGGSDKNVWRDTAQLAFLAAREAGISVATAAGNSGQECGEECFSALDNSSPWVAQVAATTSSRKIEIETKVDYAGFAADSDGQEVPSWSEEGIVGGSLNPETITGVVVWAKDYADVNGDIDRSGYCGTPYPQGTFDFYKDGTPIEGAASGDTDVIVVCARNSLNDANGIARTAKVDNVKAGGADAFIMYNSDVGIGTVLAAYSLPGVHLTREAWLGTYPDDGLEDWVDSTTERGHMITINKTVFDRDIDASNKDWLAAFSSRGPSRFNPEVLAPNMAAPGVDIYAAFADEHPFMATPYGQDFGVLSGTSMASPHVAGSLALLRQQHEDWTPSELQSALMMTADNVVQYHLLNNPEYRAGLAEIHRVGSGRINVAKAVEAGLVMDETAENFKAADPNNGGVPHKLNVPYLMNFSCKPQCQWARTVRATKDGTWEVSHGDTINWANSLNSQYEQNEVHIEYEPKQFSLKAGETQTIIVKASITETQTTISNSEVELHSELFLTEVNDAAPQARWPMAFKYNRGDLPANANISFHDNQGSFQFAKLPLGDTTSPFTAVHQVVKANKKELTLPKDDERIFPDSTDAPLEDRLDEATHTEFVTVPENTSRLIAEVFDVTESEAFESVYRGFPSVWVGKDYDNDGEVDFDSELVCYSTNAYETNYCNLQYPTAGDYWVVIYNSEGPSQYDQVEETFSYAVETVPMQADATASMTLTDAEQGNFDFAWDLDAQQDDVFYTQVTLGSSAANPTTLGSIPVKLTRGENRATFIAGQEKALLGDSVPFSIKLLPNHSGSDREFTVSINIPEGVNVDPQRVVLSNTEIASATIEDNVLTITGTQLDSSDWKPEYVVTTNVTDQYCKTPDFGNTEPGGYVDLAEFGITPMLSGFDENGAPNYRNGYALPMTQLSGGVFSRFSLYNNTESNNLHTGVVQVRGSGFVDFSASRYPVGYHQPFPYNAYPYESVAALWRGTDSQNGNFDLMSVGLDQQAGEGISVASTSNGWVILEWDDASDYGNLAYDFASGQYTMDRRDNRFDFEVIFNGFTSHNENEHEIYFAYDNLDYGSQNDRGSIGVQGYRGLMTRSGPTSGFYGENIAFNEISDVIDDGTVICLDYRGPESSIFTSGFYADIPSNASGKVFTFDATFEVQGQAPVTVSKEVKVDSNITLADIDDMTTPESTAISFDVLYADELSTANEIIVEGAHVTSTVEGNTVTLMPETDYHGTTQINVTVADIDNPADSASTSFTLTVESDGVEPVQPEPEEDNGSSGSIAWYLLALAGLAATRRKRLAIR